MRKIVKIFILSTLLCPLSSIYADFEDLGWGVAGAGLSNSVCLSKKIPSIFAKNPSASQFSKIPYLTAEYENLYPSLTDGSKIQRNIFTYAQGFSKNGIGLGFEEFFLKVDEFGKIYDEKIFLLNYSRKLNEKNLVGLNLRYLFKKYGSDNYTFNAIDASGKATGESDPLFANGFSKEAYAFDVGYSRVLSDFWFFGLSANYLSSPDVSLGGGDRKKPTFKISVTLETKRSTVGNSLEFNDGKFFLSSGFEKRFFSDAFKVRGGLSIGNYQMRNLSIGLGYVHLKKLAIDWAFIYPFSGLQSSGGRQRISLSYLFGEEKEEVKPQEVSPSKIEELLIKANNAFNKQDWKEAFRFAREVLSLDPSNSQARKIYSVSFDKMSSLAKPFIEEGKELTLKGKFSDAFKKFNSAFEISPFDDDVKILVERMKKVTKVVSSSIKPTKPAWLLRKGVSAFLNSKGKIAINCAIYLTQIEPSYINRKILEIFKAEFPEIYNKIQLIPGMNLVEQKLYVALKNIYSARYDIAIMECQDVLELEPENVLAMTRLGSAYYALGNRDKAIEIWKRALEIDPNNKDILDFLEIKTPDEIKNFYEKRKTEKQERIKNVKDFYLKGYAALRRGELNEARSYLKKATSIKGEESEVLQYKKKAQKLLAECEAKIRQKQEKNKKLMKVYWVNGMSYYSRGEYKKAIAEFEKILRINPNHAPSKKMLKLCKEKLEK